MKKEPNERTGFHVIVETDEERNAVKLTLWNQHSEEGAYVLMNAEQTANVVAGLMRARAEVIINGLTPS